MGSLRVSAEHRPSPAADGSAVVARWRSERGGAATARTDPVNAAAAHATAQPAAGQCRSAAGDYTAPHGKLDQKQNKKSRIFIFCKVKKEILISLCVSFRGSPKLQPGSSG